MKTLPALCLGIALLVGCGDPDLDDPKTLDKITGDALALEKLQERGPDGEKLRYAPNSQTPYTGWVKSMHENGQVSILAHCKDGKPDGLWTLWHENGQRRLEAHFKDGKKDGLETSWHQNGQKEVETHFKDGKKDGLETSWHQNGQKEVETHFKDGKEDGPNTWWYENGQKEAETHWKDGKIWSCKSWEPNGAKCLITNLAGGSGVMVGWHDNGQKSWENHYKDGRLDGLETEWDEDGKVVNKVRWIDGVEVEE